MPLVASFKIEFHRFINATGEIENKLPEFTKDKKSLLALYRNMHYTRTYDLRAIDLQRTGQLGTYASSLGEEAIGAGVGHAMHAEDILVPSYREAGAQLYRGVRVRDLLLYWGGDERGMNFSATPDDFPICVPIASQTCHAVGAAFAIKYRNEPRVVVCLLGDGATSKGDFYESLNLAGVWQLPVVFLIHNNQWAISVPRSAQTIAETLAQKAVAAGVPGIQVDGNDVITVRHYLANAIEMARTEQRPSLIEALTYRMGDHTTADNAGRYRSDKEVALHEAEDPIKRLRLYLINQGIWSDDQELQLQQECSIQVEQEVKEYLATEKQPAETVFDYLYAELPKELLPQRRDIQEKG